MTLQLIDESLQLAPDGTWHLAQRNNKRDFVLATCSMVPIALDPPIVAHDRAYEAQVAAKAPSNTADAEMAAAAGQALPSGGGLCIIAGPRDGGAQGQE